MGLLIPGLVVTGLALGTVVWGRVGPIPSAKKVQPPYDLHLCPSESVDPEALERAISWWKQHGEIFTVAAPGNIEQSCVPVLVDQTMPDKYAGTVNFIVDQEQVIGAILTVQDGTDAEVLTHELGHVAGYGHVPLAPHGVMMAGRTATSGWSCRGLPKDVRHQGSERKHR